MKRPTPKLDKSDCVRQKNRHKNKVVSIYSVYVIKTLHMWSRLNKEKHSDMIDAKKVDSKQKPNNVLVKN